MKMHQLSLFLENQPGQIDRPVPRAGRGGIDILTLSLADTEQFGILRLIVSDWEKAATVLEKAGYVVNVTEVVAVEVPDRPGGLADLLDVLATAINIEYMYAFTFGRGDKAVLIFRFDEPDAAIERLQAAGINVVEGVEVYSRMRNERSRDHRGADGAGLLDPPHVRGGRAPEASAARRTSSISPWAIRMWSPRGRARGAARGGASDPAAQPTATCRMRASRRCARSSPTAWRARTGLPYTADHIIMTGLGGRASTRC